MFSLNQFAHLPEAIGTGFAYLIILLLFIYLYRRQQERPQVWKAAAVFAAGLFSFSLKISVSGLLVSLALIPLGVLFLMWFLSRKPGRWQRYKVFAWFGFWANYLFLAGQILSAAAASLLYPADELGTYVAKADRPELIVIHSQAAERMVLEDQLLEQVSTAVKTPAPAEEWYGTARERKLESFPYILEGTFPKTGSGLQALLHVSKNGKGLLVTDSSGKQLYFKLKDSIFENGGGK